MSRHPHDQADGFFDGGEDRQASRGDDAAWQLVFDLDDLSAKGLWADMRERLAKYADAIPYHDFSEQAFRRAALEGKTDIAETMLNHGFDLPADAGAAMIGELAGKGPLKAAAVIGLLLDQGYDAGEAIVGIAARGQPDMMAVLKKHGCDILQGDSFAVSLHAGNAAMMRYLFNAGADIYTPAAVSGLHGGIEKYQSANGRPAGTPDAARAAHAALWQEDERMWCQYYAATAGKGHPSLAELRAIPAGTASRSMTLMQVAARAGCFDDIVSAALRDKDNPLSADDVLRPAAAGASVLSVLAARGEAEKILDARLWWRRPDDAAKLPAALKEMGAEKLLNPAAFTADIQRMRLKNLAREANMRLRPKP